MKLRAQILLGLIVSGLMALVLFLSAGRWDLPWFWAYVGLWAAIGPVATVVVHRRDPTLLAERLHPGPGGKDPHLRRIAGPLFLILFVISGLDAGRFHWSPPIPTAVRAAAWLVLAAALALVGWAMVVNRFFSSEARIQRDRGHHVITAGPYRIVRHPGYLSVLLMAVVSPLELGSYWAWVPVVPAIAMLFRRILLEDRLLRSELEGYAGYAARVRYRLVPGLW